MKVKLPGINIQYPISLSILDGSKSIETRTYKLPDKFLQKDLLLIETPGPTGAFKARGIAIIRFGNCFEYKSKKDFYNDFSKHKVDKKSPWAWKEKKKYGWTIEYVKLLKSPIQVPSKRGYVFTAPIPISF